MRVKSAVICLGQLLCRNSTSRLPSTLVSRIEKSVNIVESVNSSLLILTGGDVAAVGITESKAMLDYIKEHYPNIANSTAIICEEKSRNTVENALFCNEILDQHDINEVTVVTNDFHAPRARLVFRAILRNAEVSCVPCHTPGTAVERLDSIAKEIKYLPHLPQYLKDRYNISSGISDRAMLLAIESLELEQKSIYYQQKNI